MGAEVAVKRYAASVSKGIAFELNITESILFKHITVPVDDSSSAERIEPATVVTVDVNVNATRVEVSIEVLVEVSVEVRVEVAGSVHLHSSITIASYSSAISSSEGTTVTLNTNAGVAVTPVATYKEGVVTVGSNCQVGYCNQSDNSKDNEHHVFHFISFT